MAAGAEICGVDAILAASCAGVDEAIEPAGGIVARGMAGGVVANGAVVADVFGVAVEATAVTAGGVTPSINGVAVSEGSAGAVRATSDVSAAECDIGFHHAHFEPPDLQPVAKETVMVRTTVKPMRAKRALVFMRYSAVSKSG